MIIDPYNQDDMQNLAVAAGGCSTNTNITDPFCGPNGTQAVNGIYISVNWCSWELANVTLNKNFSHQSCYYIVDPTNGGIPLSAFYNDMISPCGYQASPTKYDYGPNCPSSVLVTALGYIKKINTLLANDTISTPLKISVGMTGGPASAMRFIYNAANQPLYYDVPASIGASYCLRLPNIWYPSYITEYYTALDSLISAVSTTLGTPIAMVKLAPGNVQSDEYDIGGNDYAITAPADQNNFLPPGAIPLFCPKTPTGADTLNIGYSTQINTNLHYTGSMPSYPDCRGYPTIAQATECAFGIIMGHIRGTLDSLGMQSTLEAIETNNGMALADVACGQNGIGEPTGPACVVEGTSPSGPKDQFGIYYLFADTEDLRTPGSVAQLAAKYGYDTVIANGTPAFTNLLTVTWTGLQIAPTKTMPGNNFFTDPLNTTQNSINQVGCALNDAATNTVDDITYVLNNIQTPFTDLGGIILSWQTVAPNLGGKYCTINYGTYSDGSAETNYGTTLASGYNNGGIFIKVWSDTTFAE